MAGFADIDWDDPEQEAVLAGFPRREVRHAEHWDDLGQDFTDLYDLAELVCQWKVGGLPRGGILYGLIPAEMDANAAAAKFLRERRPEAINAVLTSDMLRGTQDVRCTSSPARARSRAAPISRSRM